MNLTGGKLLTLLVATGYVRIFIDGTTNRSPTHSFSSLQGSLPSKSSLIMFKVAHKMEHSTARLATFRRPIQTIRSVTTCATYHADEGATNARWASRS